MITMCRFLQDDDPVLAVERSVPRFSDTVRNAMCRSSFLTDGTRSVSLSCLEKYRSGTFVS